MRLSGLVIIIALLTGSALAQAQYTEADLLNLSREGLMAGGWDGCWKAIKYADKALEINRSLWEAWLNEALAYMELEKWPELKVCGEELIRTAPNQTSRAAGHYYRALAYHRLGDLGQAEKDYATAVDLLGNPCQSNETLQPVSSHIVYSSLCQIGWIRWYRGDLDSALEHADRALQFRNSSCVRDRLDPLEAYYLKVSALVSMDDFDRAIRVSDEAINQDGAPDLKAWIYFKKGAAFIGKNDMKQMRSCMEQAISLKADESDFWLFYGIGYFAEKEYGMALAAVERALTLNSSNGRAWITRGEILKAMGYEYEAIESFKMAGQVGGFL